MRGVSGKRKELVEQKDGILSCRERERERFASYGRYA